MTPTHPPPHLVALVDEQQQRCKDVEGFIKDVKPFDFFGPRKIQDEQKRLRKGNDG